MEATTAAAPGPAGGDGGRRRPDRPVPPARAVVHMLAAAIEEGRGLSSTALCWPAPHTVCCPPDGGAGG